MTRGRGKKMRFRTQRILSRARNEPRKLPIIQTRGYLPENVKCKSVYSGRLSVYRAEESIILEMYRRFLNALYTRRTSLSLSLVMYPHGRRRHVRARRCVR